MKVKVSDYIAELLVAHGISQVFTVTGGGAMHMNDSLGHHPGLTCMYQHHEQAAAMAAEAYARVDNQIAAVCVTTGPGATNAITGALCGWMDSIPMFILSGQVRYDTTVRSSGLNIRTMGVQEYDVVQSVAPMTKYAVMITDPTEVRYHVEKALYLAAHGRPGPVWLDVPLNIQGATVDTEDMKLYDPAEDVDQLPSSISDAIIDEILDRISRATRPVIFAGHGIRLAGAYDAFLKLVDILKVPVATGMSSIDLIPSDSPYYVGRSGGTGDRAGNFAVQTSDVLLSIGSRLSFTQTGFNYKLWAAHAYTILNDIDGEELKKPSLHVDLPVVGDAKELIEKLTARAIEINYQPKTQAWLEKCLCWREQYPVVTEKNYVTLDEGRTNTYAFYHELSRVMKENSHLMVSCGTSRVAGSQAFLLKEGQRFYTNAVTASMGYGLPAAIGICVGTGYQEVVGVMGEGCLQMNIQEFQTIKHHQLPLRIFIVNNEGYHSIRQTQTAYFNAQFVGIGEQSGDLSFPDLSKLVPAYGIHYAECHSSDTLYEDLKAVFEMPTPVVCQVFVTKQQKTEPKMASRQLPDGTFVSASLEDLAPFLPKEVLEEIWK